MIRLLHEPSRVPVALRNLSSTRTWRPADMVNWHRLVAPLRSLATQDSAFAVYHVFYDMCTTFEVTYEPVRRVRPDRAAAQ
jgi:hypothetical protein